MMLSATFAEQAVSLLLWLCVGSSPRSYQLCSPQMLAADSSRGTAIEKPYEACFQICCSRCAAAEGNDAASRREMSRPVSDGGKDPRGALGEFVIFFSWTKLWIRVTAPQYPGVRCRPGAVCAGGRVRRPVRARPTLTDKHDGSMQSTVQDQVQFFLTDVAESRSGRAGGGCPDPAPAATARRIRGPM